MWFHMIAISKCFNVATVRCVDALSVQREVFVDSLRLRFVVGGDKVHGSYIYL